LAVPKPHARQHRVRHLLGQTLHEEDAEARTRGLRGRRLRQLEEDPGQQVGLRAHASGGAAEAGQGQEEGGQDHHREPGEGLLASLPTAAGLHHRGGHLPGAHQGAAGEGAQSDQGAFDGGGGVPTQLLRYEQVRLKTFYLNEK